MGPRESLNRYLKLVADKPFEYGVHDCVRFTNEAWHAMYGKGWADDWIGRYDRQTKFGVFVKRPDELRAEFGYQTFDDAADDRLTRIQYVPPFGALVATADVTTWMIGYALGICVGAKCAFLSDKGVIYRPVSDVTRAWV